MNTKLLVATRKGAFVSERRGRRWQPRLLGHAGVGVNFLVQQPERGDLWAALGHGHWGAKLSRSRDGGETWQDASQIKYPSFARYLAPPDPTDTPDDAAPAGASIRDATLLKLWCIAGRRVGNRRRGPDLAGPEQRTA